MYMVKISPRLALEESEPIGVLPARMRIIHDIGCHAGGASAETVTNINSIRTIIPDILLKKRAKIIKFYKSHPEKCIEHTSSCKKIYTMSGGGCGCGDVVPKIMSGGGTH